MANLVLSNISIDSSGVVSGIRQSNQALGEGDAGLRKFGASSAALGSTADVVVGKLFNFRQAFSAVARSLGVVGLITGLAFALKGLVMDLVESTTWFKNASNAVTDWWNALAKGETAIGRTARALSAIKGGSIGGSLGELEDLVKAYEDAIGKLQRLDVSTIVFTDALTRANKDIQEHVDKLRAMGAARDAIAATGAGTFADLNRPAAPVMLLTDQQQYAAAVAESNDATATAVALATDHAREAVLDAEAVRGLNLIIREHALAQAAAGQATSDAIEEWQIGMIQIQGTNPVGFLAQFDQSMAWTTENTETLSAAMNANADAAARMGDVVGRKLAADLELASLKMAAANSVAQSFAGALSSAAVSGSTSWKQMLGDMLSALGTMMLSIGAAAAVRAAFGEYEQWEVVVAAGAVATTAFAAARALGSASNYGGNSGGSTSGGGHRQRDTTQQLQGGRVAQHPSVTINVQGSMMGTDPDNLARDIAKLINTAQSDGSV